jgi:hypothetical protein
VVGLWRWWAGRDMKVVTVRNFLNHNRLRVILCLSRQRNLLQKMIVSAIFSASPAV